MSRSAYCRPECRICGQHVSTAGFAKHNHMMKHVREGRAVKREDGRIVPSLRHVVQQLDEQSHEVASPSDTSEDGE